MALLQPGLELNMLHHSQFIKIYKKSAKLNEAFYYMVLPSFLGKSRQFCLEDFKILKFQIFGLSHPRVLHGKTETKGLLNEINVYAQTIIANVKLHCMIDPYHQERLKISKQANNFINIAHFVVHEILHLPIFISSKTRCRKMIQLSNYSSIIDATCR